MTSSISRRDFLKTAGLLPVGVGLSPLLRGLRPGGSAAPGRQTEIYDLESDPEELENLQSRQVALASDLVAVLKDKLREVNEPYL